MHHCVKGIRDPHLIVDVAQSIGRPFPHMDQDRPNVAIDCVSSFVRLPSELWVSPLLASIDPNRFEFAKIEQVKTWIHGIDLVKSRFSLERFRGRRLVF